MAEVRAKFPQYNDMSDDDLASALHRKFYADMPEAEFRAKIGLDTGPQTTAKTDRIGNGSIGPEAVAKEPASVAESFVGSPAGVVANDIARSGLTGMRMGLEGAAGTLGDAANVQGRLAGWVAGKAGASAETQANVQKWGSRLSPGGIMPSTEQIRENITDPLVNAAGGQDVLAHTPQTVPGEYARTIGEFASGAVAPGGIVRKAAQVIIPAVASETAGQLTKGTAAEPYARLAGGLAGAGVSSLGGVRNAVTEAAAGAPTAAGLKATTDQLYGALRDAGIKYDADAFSRTVHDIAQELHTEGLVPSIAKEAHGVVNGLVDAIGHSPDFSDINGLVSSLGGAARDLRRTGQNQAAKGIDVVRDHLMDFEAKAPMVSRVPLPRAEFDTLRKTARDTARRNIQARTLDGIAEDADAYAAGREAGIRQGIRNLVKSGRGKQLFNQRERAALLDVANGRKALLTLSKFGFDFSKLGSSSTLIPAIGTAAAGFKFGTTAGVGLAAAGTAAKQLSPHFTSKAFETASAAIRSGKLRDSTIMPAIKAKWLQRAVRQYLAAQASASAATQPSPLELTVHAPSRQPDQP